MQSMDGSVAARPDRNLEPQSAIMHAGLRSHKKKAKFSLFVMRGRQSSAKSGSAVASRR